MQLHNGQVPDDKVWAVLSSYASDPSNQFIDWYITASGSTLRYGEVVEYLKRKSGGGTVSRWLIQLPRQGMESYDVESVVQKQLVIDVQPSHATRLDVYTEQKRRALA